MVEDFEVQRSIMRRRSEMGSRGRSSGSFGKMMQCLCSGEQLRAADELALSDSESLSTRDHKTSEFSSRAGAITNRSHTNIEEAESSLRESGGLNYEVCLL